MDAWTCQICVPVFNGCKVEKSEWWNGINVYCKKRKENIISYAVFLQEYAMLLSVLLVWDKTN